VTIMTSCDGYISARSIANIRDRSAEQYDNERKLKSSLCVAKKPIDPQIYLMNMLIEYANVNIHSLSYSEEYYIPNTDENIQAYTLDIVSAVRRDDLDTLKRFKEAGRNFQCRNKVGESLIHIACRRGSTEVVRFLIETGCSIRVKDDCGRTPFHDALWLARPNFDLIALLIHHDAKLLLAKDNRGFYPFAYAPRDHSGDWIRFLKQKRTQICSNILQ